MPNNKPDMKYLYQIFNLITPQSILGTILNNPEKSKFYENIINTTDSFLTCEELKKQIDIEEIKHIKIYEQKIDDTKRFCSVFVENSVEHDGIEPVNFLDRSLKDISNIDLFFNAIPTIELAKIIPHLSVKFLLATNDETLKDEKHLTKYPSLQNFLYLQANENIKTVNAFNKNNIIESDSDEFKRITNQKFASKHKFFITDESIYTSPATISDTFKPFISLKKADIKVTPTVDYAVAFEEFNLSIVFHDRKYMNNFPHLFGVEYRDDLYALIEYGWSHPGDEATDHYAYFFNKTLRKKTLCKITNSSYSFDDVGQVNIDMKLGTVGSDHLYVSNFLDALKGPNEEIKRLSNAIKIFTNKYELPPSLSGYALLDSLSNGSVRKLSDEDTKKINNLIELLKKTNIKDDNAVKQLKTDIVTYKEYLAKDPKNIAVSTVIVEEFKNFNEFLTNYRRVNGVSKELIEQKFEKKGDVFLHEIFSYFISKNLLKYEKNFVDEVQFIYYNFGINTIPAIRGDTIANFKIFKDDLKSIVLNNKQIKNYSMEEFIRLIINKFVNDLKTPCYNLAERNTELYSSDAKKSQAATKSISEAIEKKLKNFKEFNDDFKRPNITFRIEFINKIIRIHVFDQTCVFKIDPQKKYSDQVALYDKNQKAIEKIEKEAKKGVLGSMDAYFKAEPYRKDKQNIAEQIYNSEIKSFNFNQIKAQYKTIYPNLNFNGSSTSVVKSFQLSTSMDSQTTTHLLIKNRQNDDDRNVDNSKPQSNNTNKLDQLYTKIVPGKITMQTLGFPIADVHQTFFIDLNTGTDADNLYNVISVNHSIEPGSFKTNFELSNQDRFGSYTGLINKINSIDAGMNNKKTKVELSESATKPAKKPK